MYIRLKENTKKLVDGSQPIIYFDLDNTLYPEERGIHHLMAERIANYLRNVVGVEGDPVALAQWYYKNYGLAIRGMIEHHHINADEYDRIVDGGLPLENLLSEDRDLIKMLSGMKGVKWIFTNAGKNHALRVMKILNIMDQFEGVIYCDYSESNFLCKPDPAIYPEAMRIVGVENPRICYFIDDSAPNILAARNLGWITIHVTGNPIRGCGHFNIQRVHELQQILPELWG